MTKNICGLQSCDPWQLRRSTWFDESTQPHFTRRPAALKAFGPPATIIKETSVKLLTGHLKLQTRSIMTLCSRVCSTVLSVNRSLACAHLRFCRSPHVFLEKLQSCDQAVQNRRDPPWFEPLDIGCIRTSALFWWASYKQEVERKDNNCSIFILAHTQKLLLWSPWIRWHDLSPK